MYHNRLHEFDELTQIYNDAIAELDALREDCLALDPVIQCRLFQMLIEYFKVLRSTFKLGVRTNRPGTAQSNRAFSVCSFDATLSRRPSQIPPSPALDRFSAKPNYQNDMLQDIISQISSVLQSKFTSAREAYAYLDQSQVGYISISMLRVRLESLGVPSELTNQLSFIQYLQQLCPKRLITMDDFSDMFPLLNQQHQSSNSVYDSYQNAEVYDTRQRSASFQAERSQIQYQAEVQSRPNTAMSYQSHQTQSYQQSYDPPLQQNKLHNPPVEVNPVHNNQPQQQQFRPPPPGKFLDDKPLPAHEKFLDDKPMPAQQQKGWVSSTNDLQSTIDPFKASAAAFEQNRDAELAGAMKQSNKTVVQLFNEFKASGDKAVTQESLAKKMREYGIDTNEQVCLNLIQQFDTNGDDKLHLLEWEVLCKALLGQDHIDRLIRNQCNIDSAPSYPPNQHLKYVTETLVNSEPSISNLFKKMCVSGARRCSIEDMFQALQQYGIHNMTMQDIQQMIAPFDKTNQGSLSRGEFIRFINAGKL